MRRITNLSFLLFVLIINIVDGLLDIAQNKVAMAVVCLNNVSQMGPKLQDVETARTCNLPLSSLSPLSLTKTTSLRRSRTRSRGSETWLVSSAASAILNTNRRSFQKLLRVEFREEVEYRNPEISVLR